jgi:hypothetical protein
MPMVFPRTTRDYLEEGLSILAVCCNFDACSHSATLDMRSLIQHVGWDFDLVECQHYLDARPVCSICGWRNPHTQRKRVIWPEKPGAPKGGVHSAYGEVPFWGAVQHTLELNRKAREWNEAQPEPFVWKGKHKGGRKFGKR